MSVILSYYLVLYVYICRPIQASLPFPYNLRESSFSIIRSFSVLIHLMTNVMCNIKSRLLHVKKCLWALLLHSSKRHEERS